MASKNIRKSEVTLRGPPRITEIHKEPILDQLLILLGVHFELTLDHFRVILGVIFEPLLIDF